jgi:Flp pilus assembly protein TadG
MRRLSPAADPRARWGRWQHAVRQPAGQRHDARGSVTVELVLTLPLLLLMLWFLVYCGRLSDTRLQIEDAAHQAARAATLDRSPSAAAADARSTAATALSDAGVTCQALSVTTRGSLQAGSTVTVAVSCTVGLHDLALLQVPGTTNLTAEFASPVDVYRSRALGLANSRVGLAGWSDVIVTSQATAAFVVRWKSGAHGGSVPGGVPWAGPLGCRNGRQSQRRSERPHHFESRNSGSPGLTRNRDGRQGFRIPDETSVSGCRNGQLRGVPTSTDIACALGHELTTRPTVTTTPGGDTP